MTVVHIVSFTIEGDEHARKALASSFKALATECIHPDTKKPYIKSFKCGKQNSPENMHKGLELVFVAEFENIKDRDYYLDNDPAHQQFKKSVRSDFKILNSLVLDFTEDEW